MPTNAFDRYVRQTMAMDFEPFIAPLASLPRKTAEQQSSLDEQSSVVGAIDQVALLQALDEQLTQHPGLTELAAFNQAIGLAHDEDVSTWVETIAQWMEAHESAAISLLGLQQALGLPLVQIWLALLLGGFAIEQRGSFYETGQLWVAGLQ